MGKEQFIKTWGGDLQKCEKQDFINALTALLEDKGIKEALPTDEEIENYATNQAQEYTDCEGDQIDIADNIREGAKWVRDKFLKQPEENKEEELYFASKEGPQDSQRQKHPSGNVGEQDGINTHLLDVWHEIESWYGDIEKKETGEELLKRLQSQFLFSKKDNTVKEKSTFEKNIANYLDEWKKDNPLYCKKCEIILAKSGGCELKENCEVVKRLKGEDLTINYDGKFGVTPNAILHINSKEEEQLGELTSEESEEANQQFYDVAGDQPEEKKSPKCRKCGTWL